MMPNFKNKLTLSVTFLLYTLLLFSSCTNIQDGSDSNLSEIEIIDSSYTIKEEQIKIDSEKEDLFNHDFYIADIDGDSISDTFFIIPPIVNENADDYAQDCNSPCITKISFGSKLPPILIQQSLGGEVEVIDDIDEDGYKEIAFFPYWFQSCWSRIDIYSYSKDDWKLINSIDYNSCDETLPTSFEKIDKGLLRVITNGAQFGDDENFDEIENTVNELPGLEAKIYDIEVK